MILKNKKVVKSLYNIKVWLYANRVVIFSLLLIILIMMPLLIYGTFYVDDWSFVELANRSGGNLIEVTRYQWSMIGFRPVAALLLSVVPCMFRQNYWQYALLNISVLLISFNILIKVICRYLGIKDVRKTLIVVPIFFLAFISTTFLFSPVTHVVTAFSLLMWSISLLLAEKYSKTNNLKYVLLSIITVLVGALCYEIFLPLLIINILVVSGPITTKGRSTSLNLKYLIAKMGVMIAGYGIAILASSMYQQYIAKYLGAASHYRVANQSMESIIKQTIINIYELCMWLLRDIPSAARLAISHSSKNWLFVILSATVASALSLGLYKVLKNNTTINAQRVRRLLYVCVALLIINSVFIALSRYPLTIEGYSNRMMLPFWIALCLGFIGLVIYLRKYTITYLLSFIAVFLLCMAYLGVQAEFTKASELRKKISEDVAGKVIDTHENGIIILANVPQCTTQPIINIEVFSVIWDINGMLELSTKHGEVEWASNIQLQNHNYAPWYEIDDKHMKLFGSWTLSSDETDKVYLYTYNIIDGTSSIEKANSWARIRRFTSKDNLESNHTCRHVFNYGKAAQDLNAFLSNHLKD